MSQFEWVECRPLCLSLDKVGPFQGPATEIDFTDENDEPCNLFLLLAPNGRGKTTAMEVMARLMALLHPDKLPDTAMRLVADGQSNIGIPDLDGGEGRAQLDLRVVWRNAGVQSCAILSLFIGPQIGGGWLKKWNASTLARAGANDWQVHGLVFSADRWTSIPAAGWGASLIESVKKNWNGTLGGFEAPALTLPTVIYFSAYRNVPAVASNEIRTISEPNDWKYKPVHIPKAGSRTWGDSLDNIWVWLKWVDDGRFERAVDLINERVFADADKKIKGIRREPPGGVMVAHGKEFGLDALSSGEKSLVQMFLQIGAYMTRNTILLIDEPEVHLHENWCYRLFHQLKRLAAQFNPGLTVIVATHSKDIMRSFGVGIPEPNLRKGGFLFETPEEEARAAAIKAEAAGAQVTYEAQEVSTTALP